MLGGAGEKMYRVGCLLGIGNVLPVFMPLRADGCSLTFCTAGCTAPLLPRLPVLHCTASLCTRLDGGSTAMLGIEVGSAVKPGIRTRGPCKVVYKTRMTILGQCALGV